MRLCQKLLKQEGTVRRIESMQQSSATPKFPYLTVSASVFVAKDQARSVIELIGVKTIEPIRR